jgi:hypothetical protein
MQQRVGPAPNVKAEIGATRAAIGATRGFSHLRKSN